MQDKNPYHQELNTPLDLLVSKETKKLLHMSPSEDKKQKKFSKEDWKLKTDNSEKETSLTQVPLPTFRLLRIRYSRTHWSWTQVWPLHWYLRNGLLRCVKAPWKQSRSKKKMHHCYRFKAQNIKRRCYGMVQEKIRWCNLQLILTLFKHSYFINNIKNS